MACIILMVIWTSSIDLTEEWCIMRGATTGNQVYRLLRGHKDFPMTLYQFNVYCILKFHYIFPSTKQTNPIPPRAPPLRPSAIAWPFAWQEFDVLEFYAGKGNLSRYCRMSGLRTGSLDILYEMQTGRRYNTNPMNLLSTSGFACLGNVF